MILSAFSYATSGWEVKELTDLQQTNLLVGRNSSGKTRIIRALQNVTSYIQMKNLIFDDKKFTTKLQFLLKEEENSIISYNFEIDNDKVIQENLIFNNRILIKRTLNQAVLYDEVINPPLNRLIIQTRRDKIAYPEIEKIINWAEGVVAISLSNLNNVTIIGAPFELIHPFKFSDLVKDLTSAQKKIVLSEAKELGYYLTELYPKVINDNFSYVVVKERFSKETITDFQLSSGFLRVLYILCFVALIGKKIFPSLLLIDDLGEGLDYIRVKKLGEKIFQECSEKDVQLIASSNDPFLMDITDIAKWQILIRNNNKINVLNKSNAEDLFNNFLDTGLNNFDFFSSNFINQFYLKKEEGNILKSDQ